MELSISGLKNFLSRYDNFAIYGCGVFAKETYHILKKISRRPDFCIVTNKKGYSEYFDDDIPIYCIKEQVENIKKNHIFMLISVSELYAKEIVKILQDFGIKDYAVITDFERYNTRYLQKYDDMPLEKCIQEIAEWYIDFTGDYQLEIDDEIHNIEEAVDGRNRNENKIIFVIGDLSPRTVKIASALIEKEYEIEMVASPAALLREICANELNSFEIQCVKCRTVQELMYRIIVGNARFVHLFTQRGNSHYDRILMKMKALFPPIVYDEYDIVNKCYIDMPQIIFDNERYCLENAEAICNRGYEIDYLKNECQFDISAKVLQFHDYCCDVQCEAVFSDDKEVSICYVGGVLDAHEYPDFAEAFLELADICRKNGCHFHVYPHTWDVVKFKDYIELSQYNEYFHFHKPVLHEELENEIAKYDFGIFPIMKKSLTKDVFAYNTHEKMVYCTTNKYFDYLDAGLPIIAAHSVKLVEFLEEKGVLLNWTIEDYDFEELRRRKKELKEKVLVERQKLQMRNHIHELIELYDSL